MRGIDLEKFLFFILDSRSLSFLSVAASVSKDLESFCFSRLIALLEDISWKK